MTRQLKPSILILAILFYPESNVEADTYQNTDDGFCLKSEDGVKCMSNDDVTLTRLESQQVGEVKEIKMEGRILQLRTLSIKPLVFEIQGFLNNDECDHFISAAKKEGMTDSFTEKSRDKKDAGKFHLIDSNMDKQLSIDEMKLTLENAHDVYLDDEDILQMYKDLKLDNNEDSFITPDELANTKPVHISEYVKKFLKDHPEKHSRYSKQTWLFPDKSNDEVFENIQRRVATVVQMPLDLIKLSDFQIVDYDVKGHYNAHWDSTEILPELPCCDRGRKMHCRICRYMTVLFYLNDVKGGGETAFPVANNETLDIDRVNLYRIAHLHKKCGEANLIVPPEKGKAIIWYNHFIDTETGWMGELDKYTLHGGCPVTEGEKWIGNFWIKTSDSKSADIEKMKMFSTSG